MLLFFLLPLPAFADAAAQKEIAHATLVVDQTAIVPGKPFHAALLLEGKPGWHTYWENPGDAGMTTSLTWTLPPGFTAGAIDWPPPQRLSEGPLVTFAYAEHVFLPVTITPPTTLDEHASYPIKLKADWLICKDICIPESADLDIVLPTAAAPSPSPAAALFAQHDSQRAQSIMQRAHYWLNGKSFILAIPAGSVDAKAIQSAFFFPRQPNLLQYAATPSFSIEDGALTLTLARTDENPEGDIGGFLQLTSADGSHRYYDLTASPASPPAAQNVTQGWLLLLLAAILGGLILNLMPCVLPVLSLKALAIVKKGGHSHAAVVRQGFAYTLGVLISFTIIAAILLALRAGGEAVGWGYQMQSPVFVGVLIYLLFLVGLNLSGYFHLPVLLGNVGGDIANEQSAKGSFFTGILATAVATPCTAPFMASAVGLALTLPAWQALLVFEALGLGLALPFLLISLFPVLRRFLPRPGAWMDTFKQFLAFPMYASVIWLLWVLTLQTGASGMAVAMSGMLAMAAVIWMKALFTHERAYRLLALALYALILTLTLPTLKRMEITGMPGGSAEHSMMEKGVAMVPYSREKLDELRAAGKPVFVDATAAWCLTCQVNARVAIHTAPVMKAFMDQGVTLMVADWTRRNDDITDFLGSFGYKGVPLYVYYPANHGEPKVLPQLLTETIIIDAVASKGE